jgi:hypothetical protein
MSDSTPTTVTDPIQSINPDETGNGAGNEAGNGGTSMKNPSVFTSRGEKYCKL